MHRMSKLVGVKLLAAAVVVGTVGWAMTDAEAVAQSKSQQHPRLYRALHELRQAHFHLKEAQGNFGDHRDEALRDVDRAIQRVEQAMRYGHSYGSKGSRGGTSTGGSGTTSAGGPRIINGSSAGGTSTGSGIIKGGTSTGSGIIKGGTSIGTGTTKGGTSIGTSTPSSKTIHPHHPHPTHGSPKGVVNTQKK